MKYADLAAPFHHKDHTHTETSVMKFHKYVISAIPTTERDCRYLGFMTQGLTVFSFNSFHPPDITESRKAYTYSHILLLA